MSQPLLFPADELPRLESAPADDGGLRGCLGELVETGYPVADALALAAAYPGLDVHVPHRVGDDHHLVARLGRDAAERLCRIAPGRTLPIPQQPYRPDHLAQLVRRDLDRGDHRHDIARRYGINERTVWGIGGR